MDVLISKGYSSAQAATELPAYLVADAITNNNEFGLGRKMEPNADMELPSASASSSSSFVGSA
jgi:hypothetical protein